MRYLNNRQITLLLASLFAIALFVFYANKNAYTVKDIGAYLESLDLGLGDGGSSASTAQKDQKGKKVDNNDPSMIEKHVIEVKVNELLKKKLDQELKFERDEMKKKEEELKKSLEEVKKSTEMLEKKTQELELKSRVEINRVKFESKDPEYIKFEYTLKSSPGKDKDIREFDYERNENIIFATVNEFGINRKLEDFFTVISGFNIPNSKTTLAILISKPEVFEEINKEINDHFARIEKSPSHDALKNSYTKVVLIRAPFLEKQLDISRAARQKPELQAKRRKVLSKLRNFLVVNSLTIEKYALFFDSDIIETPKDMFKIFVESERDIATIRIDMKNSQGVASHQDYDLNSWAGSRIKPTPEEDEKLNNDPEYVFVPGPDPNNSIHFVDLSKEQERFGIDASPSAAYELKSVGGAILFMKAEILKQGILFPPYYVIGTSWDRKEGWDGIETEGICYQANAIGYKCWGFPNLVGYHSGF